ncbi:hypothetical protein ACPOL_1154 [Acidisarcina polymorpha]|uniref:DUF2339 domain-containing protein n=1 Tax=Acidisarcina polymorpha TaxID=2211140 RepID=A0A2Z5FUT0_9BACT|nr:DUF2339 domain-containing protein [Acidisarcina polymorpha]AXC10502.1 hypothetical protein ACPOL_1154 [Acidisarcina polymorpha]
MDSDRSEAATDDWRDELAALRRRVEVLEERLGDSGRAPSLESQANHQKDGGLPDLDSKRAPTTYQGDAPAALPHEASEKQQAKAPADAKRNHPSALESKIGALLFNRVGIFAVLAAAAWFLKLAIDREWIGPGIRVVVGLVVAIGLFLWSEWFRHKSSLPFSLTLKALGSGIAYLSLWACFSLYHLLPAAPVFTAMVAVTVMNAVLAWRQNSELLAALALAGGLLTPALLTNGSDSEWFLLSYLLLLDGGALLLMAVRPWPGLAIGAFIGTTIYFATSWLRFFTAEAAGLTGVFIALFFAVFTAAPMLERRARSVRLFSISPSPSGRILSGFPIAVGVCAFLEAYHLFSNTALSDSTSWIAVSLAAVYTGLVFAMRQSQALPAGDTLLAVHLCLAAGFLALAGLLQFHGYGIPLCWIAELVVLQALSARFDAVPLARVMRGCAGAMLLLSFGALLLLDGYDRPSVATSAFLNAHFGAYLAGLAGYAIVVALSSKALRSESILDASVSPKVLSLTSWKFLAGASVIAFNVIALAAVTLQINLYWKPELRSLHQSVHSIHQAAYVDFTYSAWFMFYGAVLMAAGFLRRSAFLRWQALVLLIFSIGKVFLVDTSHLNEGYRILSYLGLGVLLLAVSFVYQRDLLALRGDGSLQKSHM